MSAFLTPSGTECLAGYEHRADDSAEDEGDLDHVHGSSSMRYPKLRTVLMQLEAPSFARRTLDPRRRACCRTRRFHRYPRSSGRSGCACQDAPLVLEEELQQSIFRRREVEGIVTKERAGGVDIDAHVATAQNGA